ncbi:YDG domain-containing protein [Janthinobacterium lividum]|uniref:YDG domain-containing protein n=1 Tax=Janthinobacterium lividum TaxID=29581 RepID=UPI000DFF92D6|nr:YDG domain-containing protein [Janthinobacterium lividum]MCC7717019.1 filamentous hemagglutinin N-terminal domain-containing protein [Janthinobacterium lividum]WQE27755.1 YDG domain-containing protein [Janthinobacterium lividum]STQ98670.1 Heme:hemopexin utilization protein A [Janthinobacterium lividum]
MHNHVQHASVFILTPSFSSPFALPLRRTALALLLAGCFGAAQANPALPQVVNGQATFNQQGNIFSITNTPNTIINWQSFSIHAGEITRFIQQNGNSTVLNRITGQDPSKILGALESNGKVFLINPNGIVFGQGAKVDVNGLVASSLGMTNEDFLAGKRQFTAGGVAGGVSNAGLIQAGKGGQVLLIAPNVENTGIITAPNGEVILAAGRSVQLAEPGNPQLRVLVSAPADQALNLGQIIAQGGSIGMAGALVSQRGVLNANSAVVGENGRIVLKASGKALLEAGSVTSATGAVGKGGDIQVLGEQVGLLGNAAIDASGATGGGTVLLGGDYQGKNAAVQNARQVLVGKDASVNADAVHGGNGGKVIAWGNESAQVHGSISARGGAQGGDGGFVETSGHYLAVDGIRVNTSAAHGKRGNWLLDPYDITVVAGSGGQLSSFDQFADSPATGNASIGADLISGASSNVTLQALHRINFNSAINIAQQGVSLTAQAGEIINVNAPITTNGGHITLSANDAAAGMAYGAGSNVNLNAALGSGNGDVRLSGAGVTFGVGSVNVGNGNLTLRANVAGGSIDLTGSGDQLLGSGVTGQTVLLEADNISINSAINVGGAAGNAGVTLQAFSAGRQIALGDKPGSGLRLTNAELNRIAAGSVHIGSAAGGDLTVEQAIDLATVAAGGGVKNLVLESGGNVLVSNTLALRQDGSSLTATAGGLLSLASGGGLSAGAVNLVADNMSLGGGAQSIAATAGGTVSLNRRSSVGAITLGTGAADNAGSLGLSEAELKTISAGTVQVGGDSFAGVVNLVGAMDLASQGELNQLVLRTGGNINLNGPLNVAKGLTLASGGNISASGAVSVGGNFLLDGGQWVQNSASLPAFSARGFSIAQGSFLRAAGGDGGSSSPYLIADIHGLQGIGSLGLGNSYRLAGNIDASGTANWNDGQGFVPIAGSGSGFSGVFDGAGFTLSNLKIDRSLASGSAAGLFGTVQGGTLRNLTLSGGSVTGTANVGALAGEVVSGNIDGVNSSMAVSGQRNVGGLVGSNGGAITLSASSGAVTGINADGGGAIGGLAGLNASGASITTSYATGVVTGAREMIGGLVGNNQGALSQSYATGNVTGARSIGGLVGLNGGSIDDAYASGAVGRAGVADPILAWENMGGLVGESTGSVSHVFSSGAVTGSGYAAVGAVAGRVSSGSSFSYGFFNYETSLVLMDGGGSSGRSTAQMKQQGMFNDYNFSSVWRIYDGYTTPMLKAFLKPLQVNLSGNAAGKVYDGQLAAFLGSIGYVGLIDGDTGVNGSLGYGSNARNVGSYAATGLWSTKYDISLGGTTTFAITPRALTVSIGGNGKIYDGTLGYDGANFVLGNVVAGDNISISGSAAFLDKNAGNGKAVHASGLALGGNELGNYSLAATTADGTADISARVLNYGVTGAQSRIYDGTLQAGLNGYFEGLLTGDQVSMTGLQGSFRDKHVGTGKVVDYQVATGQLTGADAGNYVLNGNAGSTTADITARVLNYGVTGAQSRVYDGTLQAALNGYFEGLVTGDQVSMAGLQGSFRDKHVGTGKVVDYQVATGQLTGSDAGNYVLNGNAGSTTADITARVLNYGVTGAQSRVYDGTLQAGLNGYFEGLVTGDQVSMAGLQGSFRDKHVGTGKVVDYQVATGQLTGADAGNYVLNGNAGSTTADITARTLNVSFNGINKTYDGTTGAQVHFGDDRIQGDALTVAGNAAFGNRNAGTGKAVNVTDVALSGGDAGNYVLGSNAGSTTADIAARTLNVSFNGVNKTYDGTTGAQVNFGDDRIQGDALTVAGNAAFGNRNAGTGKAVNVTDVALSGGDAGNYVLGSNAGSTTADIAARTLNVSFNGVNKTYDGTTGAQVHFGDDRIQGDALTVAGNAAFGNKNAGASKAVNVTDVALSGGDAGNYVLDSNAGSTTADIAARTLNVSFNGVNKTYDGTTGAQVHFGDDRIQGDALSVSGSAAFGNRNAGAGKAVNVTDVALSGGDAGNYVLSSNAGSTTADIAARALNLSGVVGSKVYDGTTGAQLSLGDDRVAGDSLTASAVASFADKNVGAAKAVQLSGAALTGADAGNYFIVLPTGLLASITPASLTLASLSAAGKVYDGTTSAAVSASANGVLGQDVVSVVGGSGSFADKNAGTGKLVTASGFRLAGADAGNYTLETTGGTAQASIAQKQLSTWVGSGSGLWSDAANWDGGVVPEGANVLAVDFSNSKGIVTYSAAAGSTILKNLNSATGLLLTGGSLTLGESALDLSVLSGLAGLEINGGSLLLNGSLSAERYAQGGGMLSGKGNLLVANSFSQAAGAIRLAGQLAITQAAGNLRFASLAANEVKLSALNGAIGQDGALLASSLAAQARDGIVLGNAGNQVGSFTASNSAGGGIALNNTSAPGTLTLGTLTTGAGNIAIDNTGGVAAGNINAHGGNVSVTAHSPVTVNGKIEGNDIALNASTDVLLGDGAQLAAARNVSLTAGRDIHVGGNAQIVSGGNFAASAEGHVRFADTASVALPAASSMSMLAKTGSITGDSGVRINRQRSGVILLAPNGTVSMADAIFLPATTIDKPVIDAATSAAIDDALRIIKQADRANDTLASTPPAKLDDKKPDSKDVADATDKPTGYKFDDPTKKMYCN